MQVLKFGGTSVGSVENMIRVKNIVNDGRRKIVVLSAMSGTTNALVEVLEAIKYEDHKKADGLLDALRVNYEEVVNGLLKNSTWHQATKMYVQAVFSELKTCVEAPFTAALYKVVISKGEFLSTFLFTKFLEQEGISVRLISALDFMRVDKFKEPDSFYVKQNLTRLLEALPKADIYVTQGFVCLDAEGDIANLQRGGSDYTASIIGAAINAEEVQIWTDIDGFHNNDPRFVQHTQAISNLSFDEAAELAYFGAKILHPQTVGPIREQNIPLRLKNTMAPNAHGTLITNSIHGEGIKAIAAKDGITAIKIKSGRMLLAYGFLKRVFEIFEKHETAIDMVTTSEIAVSLTIDNTARLNEIVDELEQFALVEVDRHRTIVCLVGHHIVFHPDTPKLFQILQDVNVRMIAYGGSNNNISLLVNTSDKVETLRKLNRYVFETDSALVY
ncbi:aspartate kinase [Mangrovimonas yunxiaonensis]|uniref:Aspartokinase n=1 Tax=Mangrovimonas yunxiaonensis TaxID=1197477 RepID=A0A084TL85_9FLAO|nr:aspartate kinase [Mangrovimonas yunxiaonensis]KFB01471.1 aspartate kinase [Mangrovimonas yunxiaonensis]GGH36479.1 aspartokinase [Mangrovimonas yunxiaonensis]